MTETLQVSRIDGLDQSGQAVETCAVIDPAALSGCERLQAAAPLGTLEGRTVAVLDIAKIRSDAFVDQVEADLVASAGQVSVERGMAPPSQRLSPEELSAIADKCDGAVLALADCGTCTSWTLFDAVELHRRGCRTVLVTTEALRPTVDALAPRLGLSDLPVVEVAVPNREQLDSGAITAAAAAAWPGIEAALLR